MNQGAYLRLGTGDGVIVAGDSLKVRQENIVRRRIRVQQRVEKTMGQFHRIAKRGVLLVNPFLRGAAGYHNIIAQLGEEIGIEGII